MLFILVSSLISAESGRKSRQSRRDSAIEGFGGASDFVVEAIGWCE
jgi:hypothetical protein